ncbi:MAG TPA: SUMF1/EgtB/PvdO family nonheme iron enzyme, partial [Armatimonadota bacterium]|nr:SUMF1/EgtB/PvdO family nonheme iron enzyme [Armatimonadota bacterium]
MSSSPLFKPALCLLICALVSVALTGCGRAPAAAPAPPPGMVRIPGGTFRMGTDSGFASEGPAHAVSLRPFFIDRHEVTNAEFARFVAATGYRTVAEKWGWSGAFDPKQHEWLKVEGADWRHPLGRGSGIDGRESYPVVQVCYDDALAYAAWAGKRLPTEAEWERAARGGLEGAAYPWGNQLRPSGRFMANYWQGDFPDK